MNSAWSEMARCAVNKQLPALDVSSIPVEITSEENLIKGSKGLLYYNGGSIALINTDKGLVIRVKEYRRGGR